MTSGLPPLLLIGGGKMGGAMLSGWVERGLAPSVVVDPAAGASAFARDGVVVVPSLDAVPEGFSPACTVLAVKPQQADAVLAAAGRFARGGMALSIMAGTTIDRMRAGLGEAPVVRAMPNTPAAIGRGITVAVPGPGVTAAQRELADTLLRAVGAVAWVEDEALIDPVTAVSGSGPAYVFLLAELMEQAGVEQGLPPGLARQLARVTIEGAGALLVASEETAAQLRVNVTSPKGTTERALSVLMPPDAWPALVSRAVAEATARSRELGAGRES